MDLAGPSSKVFVSFQRKDLPTLTSLWLMRGPIQGPLWMQLTILMCVDTSHRVSEKISKLSDTHLRLTGSVTDYRFSCAHFNRFVSVVAFSEPGEVIRVDCDPSLPPKQVRKIAFEMLEFSFCPSDCFISWPISGDSGMAGAKYYRISVAQWHYFRGQAQKFVTRRLVNTRFFQGHV